MLNNVLFHRKVSLRFSHVVFISLGVFMTGITICNAGNTPSFVSYVVMGSTSKVELGEPSFFKISSDNFAVISGNNGSINTLTDTSQFNQDVSGKYANPIYGITELEIPSGWFATESMNGDRGLVLTMLPATNEEFFTKLNSLSNNETLPIMNLVVQDKEDLKERQMSSSLSGPSSFSTKCTELTPNSTSTINNKLFQISTMKCSTADKDPVDEGIDFGHDEITKSYKYDSPTTMYVLQLVLSSEYSSNKKINESYLSKFEPVLDDAIQTLRIG